MLINFRSDKICLFSLRSLKIQLNLKQIHHVRLVYAKIKMIISMFLGFFIGKKILQSGSPHIADLFPRHRGSYYCANQARW